MLTFTAVWPRHATDGPCSCNADCPQSVWKRVPCRCGTGSTLLVAAIRRSPVSRCFCGRDAERPEDRSSGR